MRQHLHILQHSLGLDDHGRDSKGALCPPKTYRNHYVTDDQGGSGALCNEMVAAGLMERHAPRAISGEMPIFTVMFMIATLASIGLPGLNGFVGEFLILNGSFFSELYDNKVFAILAASGVILAAVYMLWMFQRVMFGPLENEENKKLVDLNAREIGLLVPLVIFMFWIGIHPVNFTKYSENQVTELIITSKEKSLAVLETSKTEDLPEWANSFYGVDEETESESLMVSTK